MATIVKTVGATGRDYATWQAAIDSIPKDLVGSGNNYIVRGYADAEFTGTTSVAILTGFTSSSATNNIRLECAAGQSFRDHATINSGALKYNAARGVALRTTTNGATVINSNVPYTEIDGFQIYTSSFASSGIEISGANSKITNCFIDAQPDTIAGKGVISAGVGGNHIIANVNLVNRRSNGVGVQGCSGTQLIQVTLVTATEIAVGTTAFLNNSASGTPMTIRNCAAFRYTNFAATTNPYSITYCATDLATIGNGATNSVTSLVLADQFESATSATLDMRTKSTSALKDAGTTTTYTDSLGRTARPSGAAFDIGAFEVQQVATALAISGNAIGSVGSSTTLTVTPNGTLSGTVTVTPSDNGDDGAVSPATFTAPGTFTFTPASTGTKSITITNDGGLANPAAFEITVTVAAPTGAITSQPAPDGNGLVATFSTTGTPVSGVATLTPDPTTPAGAQSNTGVVALGSGTGTATFADIVPGNYVLNITLTNDGGTNTVTGTQPVTVLGVTGDPEAPGGTTSAPGAPTSVVATAGNGTITVSATAPASDGGAAITSYTATVSPGGQTASGTLPLTITGVANGVAATVTVLATNSVGPGAASEPSNSVTPHPTASINLVSAGGVSVGALTGLRWAWFDQVTPDLFAAPTDKGSVETTDSSGVLTLDLMSSTKATGQIGWLIITNSDGTTGTVHKAFSGPVAVS